MAGWAGSPAFLPAMNFVSVNLHDLSRAEFDALMAAWGYKPLHGARLWSHVHRRGATSWAEMENLPKALRARLAVEAVIPLLPVRGRRIRATGLRGSICCGWRTGF